MKNCWTYSIRNLLDAEDDEHMHVVFRYTVKNRFAWRAPRWVHSVIGWGVVAPCLAIINLAFFALRGRWLHSYWDVSGVLMEYSPREDDYTDRFLPAMFFDGEVRDSGKRITGRRKKRAD